MGGFFFLVLGGGAVITIGAAALRSFIGRKWGTHNSADEQNVEGQIVIITGANDGLGKETAYEMYRRGAIVIMACRNMSKAQIAAEDIKQRVKNGKGELVLMELDLSSFDSVRKFVKKFQQTYTHLNILINNAGIYIPHAKSRQSKTVDGNELHFQINHLSHFLLTILLVGHLKKGAPSRVVNVSSFLYEKAKLSIEDINYELIVPTENTKMVPYCNSKLANVLFTRELATRIQGNGIFTYALCPGWVKTNIFRNADLKWHSYIALFPVAFFMMRSIHQGCQTILHCALSNDCGNETGKLYRNCDHLLPAPVATDALAKKVWEMSEHMVGQKLQL